MAKEDKTKNIYDVAVIGGGPAGMMAAIQAGRNNLRVVLLEKNKQLGKKLLLTGGGRCNFTNAEFNLRRLAENYHNGEFLFHALSIFGPKEVIKFFQELGIEVKTETNGRVFPKSDSSREILESLKKYLVENNVEILLNSDVRDIISENNKITKITLENNKEIIAKKYILATGGKSYTSTGSDGFGYKLAEKLGHTIIRPRPAVSPIHLKEEWIKELQGISLKNLELNVFQNNKKKFSEEGEIMFTHFGISGPLALNISGKVGDLLEIGEVKIYMDLFPLMNQEEVLKAFEEILVKYPKQTIKNILCEVVPEKFAKILLEILKMNANKIANNMSKIERGIIVKLLKNIELTPEDILGFEGAMITRGGISLKEINHKTMQSKIVDNLFFAGEIIDIDGKTGGFNLQNCWSTGYIAGLSAKQNRQ